MVGDIGIEVGSKSAARRFAFGQNAPGIGLGRGRYIKRAQIYGKDRQPGDRSA
ncbi:UNVERIFIED_ORG: hypothetical protein M2348_003822 [Sphingomonas sp. R1F5B]